ncbi:MAG: hypothetical protein D5R97_03645 [Candidatus Syntrophonatronum acetioxidans]|uniref:Helix-hairpin-helix DNA-binding motif class 1 domain-containing protein n=1 Tax=Candidatus Syntrophonatronum acetioxidans TaxID=1795816 RepID=A0A424YG30_9FIRM|nr:MAG: hypothetical protein D5R97_03645 [Candidatus Syntrophonatronum acetioxidans]
MKGFSFKEHGVYIILGLLILAGIGYRGYQSWATPREGGVEIIKAEEGLVEPLPGMEEMDNEPSEIVIHVAGGVNYPGVYTFREGARVVDAVEAAGGFKEEARQEGVNLAALLYDGNQVYIPLEGEDYISPLETGGSSNGKININTASQEELEKLPGIGPARAQAILRDREENGPYRAIEEITRVSGIGDKTLENIKDMINL